MGRIYRGVKKSIGGFQKPVVLKQLLPELKRDPELVQLFFREAQIHATLDHANIVHIIDLVEAKGNYYIVMEYVRGTDLYRIIKKLKGLNRRLPMHAVLFIGRETLKALDYAHNRTDDYGRRLGIVHRDISPTNIMISGAGEVKLTDFGIAKSATYSSNFFRVKGKAAYMSPEQALGKDLDHRSDLFSTAVCIYEMLAGQRPFPALRVGLPPEKHFKQKILSVSQARAGCPVELDTILERSLSADPNIRFDSASELLSELEQVVTRHGLFCSNQKLATYLEETLGQDPTSWGDMSHIPTSRPQSGSSDVEMNDDALQTPTKEMEYKAKNSRKEPVGQSVPANEEVDPVGAEGTSVTFPPFPWKPDPSQARSASLPPPNRASHRSDSPGYPSELVGLPEPPPPPPPGPSIRLESAPPLLRKESGDLDRPSSSEAYPHTTNPVRLVGMNSIEPDKPALRPWVWVAVASFLVLLFLFVFWLVVRSSDV